MNKLHTYIAESEAEWIKKFTDNNNLGQQVQLSHFLVNDDGYQEPYAGGNTNEVHQHLKWLKAHNKAILERVVEMVDEAIKEQKKHFGLCSTILDKKEACWACFEDDYCEHEIKIEALEDLKAQLTESK